MKGKCRAQGGQYTHQIEGQEVSCHFLSRALRWRVLPDLVYMPRMEIADRQRQTLPDSVFPTPTHTSGARNRQTGHTRSPSSEE